MFPLKLLFSYPAVVVTAVTELGKGKPKFYSTAEIIAFCRNWRLPTNHVWLFSSRWWPITSFNILGMNNFFRVSTTHSHFFLFAIYRCHLISNFCTTWKIRLRILLKKQWWYLMVAELVKPSMVLRFLILKCYINLCFILFLCPKKMTEDLLRSCLTWQEWFV